MKKALLALFVVMLAMCGSKAHAGLCTTLGANPSQATVVSAINSCATAGGGIVAMVAGSTTVSSTISLGCGVELVGPTATPATVEFTNSGGVTLFNIAGSCTGNSNPTGFMYIHFNGSAAFNIDSNSHNNIVVEYNQMTGIVAGEGCGGACESITVNGSANNNTVSNVLFENNTVGDATSCSGYLNTDDASCAGINFTSGIGYLVNWTIRYNTFQYLQEGMHWSTNSFVSGCTGTGCPTIPTNNNVDIEFNNFINIHRIALEMQIGVLGNTVNIQNNTFGNPINGYYGTMAVSAPCCQYGHYQSTYTPVVPADVIANNVMTNSTAVATSSVIGVEMAGNGTMTDNNLIQGFFCQGVVYSFKGPSGTPWYVENNTLSGPQMGLGGSSCGNPSNTYTGYIIPESGSTDVPVQSGNVTNGTPASVTSVAPTISPAAGTVSFPLTVTLTDAGYSSGSQPLGNTGIWYTTDGSSPVPGSGTAQYLPTGGTFTLGSAATVKAVGMWGTPPQPTSYAAGYGFTPSAVVSSAYTSGGTPTATTPVFSPTPPVTFSGTQVVTVTDSTPSPTIYCTTNGTTPTTGSPVYSSAFSFTATTTLQCIATASGYAQSAVASGVYTESAPSVTGGHQANTGSVNTLYVGQTAVQQIAVANYSDGTSQNLPDTFGNTAVWGSTNGTVLQVTSGGLVSCLTVGTANSTVETSPGSVFFNPWGWTCTASPTYLPTSGLKCATGGTPSGGLVGPGGTPPTQGLLCHP